MSDSTTQQSFQRERALAISQAIQELNADGWHVIDLKTNQIDWLPEQLQGFEPDLVARRGDELVVFQVKSRGSKGLVDLDDLAKAVADVPNARFEVYWLGDEPEVGVGWDRIREYADEARTLLRSGHIEAATLIAWRAVEGALLYYAINLHIRLPDMPELLKMPWRLVSYLDSLGYLNDSDLKRLTELRGQRNAAAHYVGSTYSHPADIEYCLDLVDRMVNDQYVSGDQMIEWFTEQYDYPDVPVSDADREHIRVVLTEHYPGTPESDISEVIARIVHDAAI